MRRVEIADEARRVAPGRVDESVELGGVHRADDRGAESGAELVPRAAPRQLLGRGLGALLLLQPSLDGGMVPVRADDRVEGAQLRTVTA